MRIMELFSTSQMESMTANQSGVLLVSQVFQARQSDSVPVIGDLSIGSPLATIGVTGLGTFLC